MLELAFIQQCAPAVPPITVNALVRTESSFNPWAIGVNSASRLAKQPTSFNQAVQIADELLKGKASFDLGLGQINSKNLNYLNLTARQVLDPCTNLRALQTIFVDCFNRAKLKTDNGSQAAAMAFSCYNTGNFKDGFNNGYVVKVLNNHNYVSKHTNNDPRIYQTGGRIPTNLSASSNQAVNRVSDISNSSSIANYVEQTQNQKTNNTNTNQFSSADENLVAALVEANDSVANNSETEKTYHSWDVFKNF